MQVIEITGVTGTAPYDIYVCDITLSYCVLAQSGVTIPPNFTYTLSYPLDGADSVIVKIIDSNNCEYFEIYNCVFPSPTPSITPTVTPTMYVDCNCLAFENPSIFDYNYGYTDCDGNIFYGIIYNATILYACGKLPFADSGVNITIGSFCIDYDCPTISPTPTPSVTPPVTPTPSVTPTETPTPTPTISVTPTLTQTPTITPSITPTSTITPTPTPTITPTLTPTITPTLTPTSTPTLTPTITPSITPSITPTQTPNNFLQQENLFYILQEDGSRIIIT